VTIIDRADIFRAIEFERERQETLHPIPWNKLSDNQEINAMANYINMTELLAILVEEMGEVGRALQGESDLAEELIHVAAVAVRWLEILK
jgi:NTP pyrophosphatase (non-canonical NTP hydrolase)